MNYRDTILRFVKSQVIITVIIVIVAGIFYTLAPANYYTPAFPFLLAFFLIVSVIIYHFMLKAIEKRPMRFVNIFMLTTMFKLLAFMVVMITYALLNREDSRAFIITFFILYVVYSIVEVSSLLKLNRDYVHDGNSSKD